MFVDLYILKEESVTDPFATRRTLIMRIQDQYDEKAWEEFAEIYSRYIYAIIRRMNVSQDDANDIIQKVMLNLWKRLPQLDPDQIKRFRSYIAATTQNTVKNFIREKISRFEREQKSVPQTDQEYFDAIRLPEVDEIAEREWAIFMTNLAFSNLESKYSEDSMEVLRMTIDGIKAEDIADKMELPIKQVYNLRTRMKDRFAQEITHLRIELEE